MSLSKDDIIVKQTKEIYELKETLESYKNSFNSISKTIGSFVCIGGPLNDNNLKFNKEQIAYLYKVYNAITGDLSNIELIEEE